MVTSPSMSFVGCSSVQSITTEHSSTATTSTQQITTITPTIPITPSLIAFSNTSHQQLQDSEDNNNSESEEDDDLIYQIITTEVFTSSPSSSSSNMPQSQDTLHSQSSSSTSSSSSTIPKQHVMPTFTLATNDYSPISSSLDELNEDSSTFGHSLPVPQTLINSSPSQSHTSSSLQLCSSLPLDPDTKSQPNSLSPHNHTQKDKPSHNDLLQSSPPYKPISELLEDIKTPTGERREASMLATSLTPRKSYIQTMRSKYPSFYLSLPKIQQLVKNFSQLTTYQKMQIVNAEYLFLRVRSVDKSNSSPVTKETEELVHLSHIAEGRYCLVFIPRDILEPIVVKVANLYHHEKILHKKPEDIEKFMQLSESLRTKYLSLEIAVPDVYNDPIKDGYTVARFIEFPLDARELQEKDYNHLSETTKLVLDIVKHYTAQSLKFTNDYRTKYKEQLSKKLSDATEIDNKLSQLLIPWPEITPRNIRYDRSGTKIDVYLVDTLGWANPKKFPGNTWLYRNIDLFGPNPKTIKVVMGELPPDEKKKCITWINENSKWKKTHPDNFPIQL